MLDLLCSEAAAVNSDFWLESKVLLASFNLKHCQIREFFASAVRREKKRNRRRRKEINAAMMVVKTLTHAAENR